MTAGVTFHAAGRLARMLVILVLLAGLTAGCTGAAPARGQLRRPADDAPALGRDQEQTRDPDQVRVPVERGGPLGPGCLGGRQRWHRQRQCLGLAALERPDVVPRSIESGPGAGES